MKTVHFQTPVCSNQSSSAINKPAPQPCSFHVTQGSSLSCLCRPSALPDSPFCEQTEILWVQPLALGEQEPHIVVYPLAGVEVTGGDTSLPAKNLLSVVTHRPFCQHLLHAGWNIIWVRPGGATFLLQLPFPVTRGCFQGIEQAAKASYCSLCWHCHSASSCSTAWSNGDSAGYFPATNSCMFPSWEAGLVLGRWSDAMKFKERPEAKLQNWEEGIIAGRGTAGKTIEREMAIRKKEMTGNWRKVGLTEREWKKTLWEEWFDHFVGNTGYLNQDFKFFFFFLLFQLWSVSYCKRILLLLCAWLSPFMKQV